MEIKKITKIETLLLQHNKVEGSDQLNTLFEANVYVNWKDAEPSNFKATISFKKVVTEKEAKDYLKELLQIK